MTPKKKAKLSSPFKPHEWQEGYGIYENGFVKGAEWMLEKAMTWMKDQLLYSRVGRPIDYEKFIEDMEK